MIYTAKPSWQTGLGDTARDIPDVSFFSSDGQNKSFYIVCQSDQDITGDTGCNLTKFTSTSPFHDFQAVGGTSAATPTFAGVIALINQAKGGPQGNANYALYNTYSIAKAANKVCDSSSFSAPSTSNACVFYDTTKGNISVACIGGKPNCSNTSTAANQFGALIKSGTTLAFSTSAGYDLATGLGSVNVANLIAAWAPPSRTVPTVTLTAGTIPTTVDSPASFNGSVTGSGGTPTGLVVLENSSTHAAIDTATLSAGSYTLNTLLLPGGVYSVLAHYGGDGAFLANDSGSVPVSIAKQNSVTVLGFVTAAGAITTAAQSVAYGSNYILRIDVQNAAGQTCENVTTGAISFVCPTGKVSITDNGSALNDFPNAQNPNVTNVAALNDRGFAEDQPIQLSAGSHSIAATYPGDNSYNASSSNILSVTITKATTTSAVVSSPSSVASGGSVTLTATISSTSNSSAGPSGTVQFMNGTAKVGGTMTCAPAGATAATGASCKATLTTALSEFIPIAKPRMRPNVRAVPLGIIATLLLAFLALQRRLSAGRRLGYAAAGLLLFACLTAGFAGCSGAKGSGGGGGTPHTDTITAVYSGDANYSGSTSAAVSVTIQ
jgi:hypothetical protein